MNKFSKFFVSLTLISVLAAGISSCNRGMAPGGTSTTAPTEQQQAQPGGPTTSGMQEQGATKSATETKQPATPGTKTGGAANVNQKTEKHNCQTK